MKALRKIVQALCKWASSDSSTEHDAPYADMYAAWWTHGPDA